MQRYDKMIKCKCPWKEKFSVEQRRWRHHQSNITELPPVPRIFRANCQKKKILVQLPTCCQVTKFPVKHWCRELRCREVQCHDVQCRTDIQVTGPRPTISGNVHCLLRGNGPTSTYRTLLASGPSPLAPACTVHCQRRLAGSYHTM